MNDEHVVGQGSHEKAAEERCV